MFKKVNELKNNNQINEWKKSLSRKVQLTDEILSYDTNQTNLGGNLDEKIQRYSTTKNQTQRIIDNANRLVDTDKITGSVDLKSLQSFIPKELKTDRPNNTQRLGYCLVDAGTELSFSKYGQNLSHVGVAELKIGQAEKDFHAKVSDVFVRPLNDYLNGPMKNISNEKKIMLNKRLDLDAARGKLNRSQSSPMFTMKSSSRSSSEAQDKVAQSEKLFNEQCHILNKELDTMNENYNDHNECLKRLVEEQLAYHKQCTQVLKELNAELVKSKYSISSSLFSK